MKKSVIFTLAFFYMALHVNSYAISLNMTTDTTESITNFKTDLANCQCNLTDICDNFCCCDTSCTTQNIQIWQANSWCRQSSTDIQNFCESLSQEGYSSFQDLGCVMYSNRGTIGYFYDLLSTQSISYPTPNKFAYTKINAQTRSIQTPSNQLIKIDIDGQIKSLLYRTNGLGSNCVNSYLDFMEPGSYAFSCIYPINSQADCLSLNSYYSGSFSVCSDDNCNNKIQINQAFPTATYTPDTLCNAVKSWSIQYSLGYSNSKYTISAITIAASNQDIDISTQKYAQIKTSVTVTLTKQQSSGNPGYIFGKPLKFSSGSINSLQTSSTDQTCTISSSNTALQIIFGIDNSFTCQVPTDTNPCDSKLYIDTISAANAFSLKKYGLISDSDEIIIDGISQNTCSKQIITLNILYSEAGWVLDPQYYIIAAKITAQSPISSYITRKIFRVKWIKVESDQITTPPTNYFYEYFSYLWIPLKSQYSNFVSEKLAIPGILGAVLVIFLLFL